MDPTIEALTIYPAAWAALLQGLVDGVVFGAAVIASVLVVTVVLIACLGGRSETKDGLDEVAEEVVAHVAEPRAPGSVMPMAWGPRQLHATRRRQVCQRASGHWTIIARQRVSVD
jgi:hypothetical protein